VNGRRTFLSLFVIDLACAGAAFFAYQRGVFQAVYAADASMMTSAIAALFVVTAAWLGRQAWFADEEPKLIGLDYKGERVWGRVNVDSDFGHLAEKLAVRFGLIGTGVGIILTIKASLASASPLSALQTAFFSMICGVAAASLIAAMTFSLERGLKRARQ
jgi:hypothetical protein